MTQRLTIDAQGGLTIPAELREAAGFKPGEELAVEVGTRKIVLSNTVRSVEDYSEERIAEFASDEQAIARALSEER